MNINKYVLAAMMSAGLLGTATAQDKKTVETPDYKVTEKVTDSKRKLKYEDDKYEYKEKESKNGEVKVKGEGDPTLFNQLTNGTPASALTDSTISASTDAISSNMGIQSNYQLESTGAFNYYPMEPTIQIINGTNDSLLVTPELSGASSADNSSEASSNSSSKPGSSASVSNKNLTDTAVSDLSGSTTEASTMAVGSTAIDSAATSTNTGTPLSDPMPAGEYKYKSNDNETKIKGPNDEKFKTNNNETKIKGADDSKVKTNDNEFKFKSGDDKTKVKANSNGVIIKENGVKTKYPANDESSK